MRVETGLIGHPFEVAPFFPGVQGIACKARELEELGFDGLMVPEAAGHDPFLPLVIAAEHTRRLTLTNNVFIAFPRSPLVVAQTAWDLQRFSGGRFRLGMGTQVKGNNERRYSTPWPAPPAPRLREYILCLKAIFQTFALSRLTPFSGQHYQFTLMQPYFNPGPIEHPYIPIYIACLGKHMSRLAGELCDGVLPHPMCTPKYMKEVVLPTIEEGARKAGRQRSDIDIVGSPIIIAGKDGGEIATKKSTLKQHLSFYFSTRAYHSPLQLHGWGEVGHILYRLSVEGRWQEMPDLITDEMMEEFAIIGTYDEIVPKLKERWAGLFSSIGFSSDFPSKRQLHEAIQELRQL